MSEQIRFYSRCPNYTILKKPTILNVQNGIPILEHGEKIRFEDHEFNTSDPEIIAFLRQHKAIGVDFVEDTPERPAKKGSKAAV